MAQYAAALASRGKVWKPYYLDRVVNPLNGKVLAQGKSEQLGQVDIQPATWDLIYKALKHTVDSGTARRVKMKGLDVYGKTGPAQNPHGEDHGWFLAFAGPEGKDPEIAVAVFVEFGKSGSSVAGPVARRMLEAYFNTNRLAGESTPKETEEVLGD